MNNIKIITTLLLVALTLASCTTEDKDTAKRIALNTSAGVLQGFVTGGSKGAQNGGLLSLSDGLRNAAKNPRSVQP